VCLSITGANREKLVVCVITFLGIRLGRRGYVCCYKGVGGSRISWVNWVGMEFL
jgi:hypothetical protein